MRSPCKIAVSTHVWKEWKHSDQAVKDSWKLIKGYKVKEIYPAQWKYVYRQLNYQSYERVKKPGTFLPGFSKDMIAPETLIAYCLKKNQAYEDYPFGPEPVCMKVKGKIFAEIYSGPDNYKITLKCDPLLADVYRLQFPGVVVRGYHCPPSQQPHRNTVWVERMEEGLLLGMIDHSYGMVVKSLPRSVRDELKQGI